MHAAAVPALLALFAPAPLAPASFLVVRPGDGPIILSAPHGGRASIPGVPARVGDGINQFVTVVDTGTDALAELAADAIFKATGRKPHVVIAKFARKQIDANRPPADAYEHPAAKPVYDAYHAAVAAARAAVIKTHGRGILIDLHGQAADADAVFRGTAGGKTVAHLTDRFGKAALTGKHSVCGSLAAAGYKFVPANDSADAEDKRFGGGYIVRTYGSGGGGAFDAIQLELGGNQRGAKGRPAFAAALAAAVKAFEAEYLK